jgi:hypothetical protein
LTKTLLQPKQPSIKQGKRDLVLMKRKAIALILVSALFVSLVIGVQSAKSSSKTIVVPDDYPTLTVAVANANNGDTILVKEGIYDEPANQTLTIDKSLSIIGQGANSTEIILHPPLVWSPLFNRWGYSSIAFRVEASEVKLAGFTITTGGGARSFVGNSIQITGNTLNMGGVWEWRWNKNCGK